MNSILRRRRALMGKTETPWDEIDFSLSDFSAGYGINMSISGDSIRIYTTGPNTYRDANLVFSTQSGYEYKFVTKIVVTSGRGAIGCRNSTGQMINEAWRGSFIAGTTITVEKVFQHDPTIARFSLFCTWSTNENGDVTYQGLKIYKRKLQYLSGYDEIGTPSISSGGVLTPDANSWIRLPVNFNPENKPWTIRFRIKRTGTSGFQNLLSGTGILLQCPQGSLLTKVYLRSTSSGSFDISNGTGTLTVNSNSWVYMTLEFDGEKYRFGQFTGSGGFTYDSAIQSTTPIYGNTKVAFGAKASNTNAVQAQYDLNNIEIWIDGKLWWKPI